MVQKSWEKLKGLHADYCRISKIDISSSESKELLRRENLEERLQKLLWGKLVMMKKLRTRKLLKK